MPRRAVYVKCMMYSQSRSIHHTHERYHKPYTFAVLLTIAKMYMEHEITPFDYDCYSSEQPRVQLTNQICLAYKAYWFFNGSIILWVSSYVNYQQHAVHIQSHLCIYIYGKVMLICDQLVPDNWLRVFIHPHFVCFTVPKTQRWKYSLSLSNGITTMADSLFSCDQAARRTLSSVHPSVCLLHLFHNVPVIVSSWNFQELLKLRKVMTTKMVKVRGQRSMSQKSKHDVAVSGM